MQVGAADGADQDLDQQFAGSRGRHRLVHIPQRAGLDRSWLTHHPGLHRFRAAHSYSLPLSPSGVPPMIKDQADIELRITLNVLLAYIARAIDGWPERGISAARGWRHS